MPEAVGTEQLADRSMAILYGTETGNSQEIARELGKMAERLHFETVIDEMNSFSLVRNLPVYYPRQHWYIANQMSG